MLKRKVHYVFSSKKIKKESRAELRRIGELSWQQSVPDRLEQVFHHQDISLMWIKTTRHPLGKHLLMK